MLQILPNTFFILLMNCSREIFSFLVKRVLISICSLKSYIFFILSKVLHKQSAVMEH